MKMKFTEWLEAVNNNLIVVNIEDIRPDKNNMEIAVDSLYKGMFSVDQGPIEVYKNRNKYVVSDGHHRLLQAIIRGAATVAVKVLPSKTVVPLRNTVKLDFLDGDYYGLDSSLSNGWLIKRLR